ncbi:uncharacterized protein BDZ99DRAFT_89863 [Mytilinidion resinicola]|uniref:Uncharacterized protein n=1 Tax=Mytilinidion resinicola TaxID=574789 RepID=A0A6A6YDV9_9PEZI|nr:uncharacterized protein BDZ99DRAFT_89863 [Mytilinidion resinicola]KAF2807011.1 hypothetical protein BDZ99DRAFT_89863 [Mytilinidion resinicola]
MCGNNQAVPVCTKADTIAAHHATALQSRAILADRNPQSYYDCHPPAVSIASMQKPTIRRARSLEEPTNLVKDGFKMASSILAVIFVPVFVTLSIGAVLYPGFWYFNNSLKRLGFKIDNRDGHVMCLYISTGLALIFGGFLVPIYWKLDHIPGFLELEGAILRTVIAWNIVFAVVFGLARGVIELVFQVRMKEQEEV